MTRAELPYPKTKKKVIEYTLQNDLYCEQWIVPKGTIVKLETTQNFGWLFLPVNCQDKRGFTIPCRIFRY